MTGLPSEISSAWMQHARSDLALGTAALATPGVLPDDACFHAQQSAEKALKALLSLHEIPFPRTHALEMLLDLLKNNGIPVPDEIDEAFGLTQYAVQTRYPGDWEPVTVEEARIAIQQAAVVLAWVELSIQG